MAKPFYAKPSVLSSTLILALSIGACTNTTGLNPNAAPASGGTDANGAPAAPAQSFNRFPDIPVPTSAAMDNKRTLVFGSGETWYGQLGLDSTHSANSMFDFYKQELGGFGWEEVTSVRAPVSVLTYERKGRILSIQIEGGQLRGSKVTLTISPRGGAAPVMN